jgi:hypothetical protein
MNHLHCVPIVSSAYTSPPFIKNRPLSSGRVHYWLAATQVPICRWQVNASLAKLVNVSVLRSSFIFSANNLKTRPLSSGRVHYWLAATQMPICRWQVNASLAKLVNVSVLRSSFIFSANNLKTRPLSSGRVHYWLAVTQVPICRWQVNASCSYFALEKTIPLHRIFALISQNSSKGLIIDLCVSLCQYAFTSLFLPIVTCGH